MAKNHEIFLKHLDEVLGPAEVIRKHDCPRGGVPVWVFTYRDIPDAGMITGVTYGLSAYPHREWTVCRPEMIISIETEDQMWAWVAAYFCAEFRGEKRFRYGDVFTTADPLASDTKMDGVLILRRAFSIPKSRRSNLTITRSTSASSIHLPIRVGTLWQDRFGAVLEARRFRHV